MKYAITPPITDPKTATVAIVKIFARLTDIIGIMNTSCGIGNIIDSKKHTRNINGYAYLLFVNALVLATK